MQTLAQVGRAQHIDRLNRADPDDRRQRRRNRRKLFGASGNHVGRIGEHADPGTHRDRLQPRGAAAPVGQGERPVDEVHPQCPEVLLGKVFRLRPKSCQLATSALVITANAESLPPNTVPCTVLATTDDTEPVTADHQAPGARRNAAPMNLKNILNAAQIEIAWAPTSPGDSRGPRSTSRCLVHSVLAMVCVAAATSCT